MQKPHQNDISPTSENKSIEQEQLINEVLSKEVAKYKDALASFDDMTERVKQQLSLATSAFSRVTDSLAEPARAIQDLENRSLKQIQGINDLFDHPAIHSLANSIDLLQRQAKTIDIPQLHIDVASAFGSRKNHTSSLQELALLVHTERLPTASDLEHLDMRIVQLSRQENKHGVQLQALHEEVGLLITLVKEINKMQGQTRIYCLRCNYLIGKLDYVGRGTLECPECHHRNRIPDEVTLAPEKS